MQVAHAIYQSELVSLPVFLLQNDFYVPVNHPDSDPASYTEFIESIHVVSARNKISSMASLDTRETQEQVIFVVIVELGLCFRSLTGLSSIFSIDHQIMGICSN